MALRWIMVAYIGLMLPIIYFDLDHVLASYWFQLQGYSWQLKHHWLTQMILHDGGHDVAVGVYVVILFSYLGSFVMTSLQSYRTSLSYLSVSIPLATLSVSVLKQLTYVDCPWSMVDFGGTHVYQAWWNSLMSPLLTAGHCFPAGHASSAYMFFAVYFVVRQYRPQYATAVLLSIISVGLLFGFAQQLRGAHFISHDLTSALLCWLITSSIWHYVFQRYFKFDKEIEPLLQAKNGVE